ncbi:GxxExxY protein [Sulfuricella sp.]|uniref:GxxExxY protein n=1 Tax=Sulfuricella sp. TaxID=2099377 RepID=UPI002C7DFD0C|nr:GxxExxY protein [Sulfuricella sp.]HUX64286.1 GxxExxY protein [Sulfuricella sp.]
MNVDELNRVSNVVIGSAIEVHRALGPGLLESAYEECLAWELERAGLSVQRQINIPIRYKELHIENAYRADVLVQDELIIELKSVDALQPIHTAQLLTYLKLMDSRLGLLLNFKVDVMRNGIKRIVNNL